MSDLMKLMQNLVTLVTNSSLMMVSNAIFFEDQVTPQFPDRSVLCGIHPSPALLTLDACHAMHNILS